MSLVYSTYYGRYIKKFASQIGSVHDAQMRSFVSPLVAMGDLVSYNFPSSAEVGKEASWNFDVHNAGTDGVVAFGIVNSDGNPGNIIVRWDGKDTTLEPGYYWRVYTVSPVPNCTHLITSGKVIFPTKGNYIVRLWGMHPEGETWYYDTEASKTVAVDGAPQEWPVTRTLHLFDGVKLDGGWGTWIEKSRPISKVDTKVLVGGKLNYTITYLSGVLKGITEKIIWNDEVMYESGYPGPVIGVPITGTIDLTGLISESNVAKIGFEQGPAGLNVVTFDVTLILGYSEEPSEEPGLPFNWEEILDKYWWVAAGGIGLAGIYLLTRKGQPLIIMTQPYYTPPIKGEEK